MAGEDVPTTPEELGEALAQDLDLPENISLLEEFWRPVSVLVERRRAEALYTEAAWEAFGRALTRMLALRPPKAFTVRKEPPLA